MKRILMFLLVLTIISAGVLLGGCGKSDPGQQAAQPAPAKEESVTDILGKSKTIAGLSYDYLVTPKDGQQMAGKMWMQGKKIRTEMTVQNQKVVSILDGEANVAYTIDQAMGTAFKIPLDKGKAADTPERFTKNLDAGKVKIQESTVYDGVKCRVIVTQDVIETQDAQKNLQTKMWLREDIGIPIRVEVSDQNGTIMVIEYKNVKVGPVPADLFQIPAGMKVTDMGDLMKQIPAAPKTP